MFFWQYHHTLYELFMHNLRFYTTAVVFRLGLKLLFKFCSEQTNNNA